MINQTPRQFLKLLLFAGAATTGLGGLARTMPAESRGAVFCGGGGDATRFVFIVDGGGRMKADDLAALRKELSTTLYQFRPQQGYNIVLAKDVGSLAEEPGRLIPGTKAHARASDDFLRRPLPAGGSDPVPAFEAASRLNPQVIYFLASDNPTDIARYERLIGLATEKAPGKSVKINVLCFGKPDATVADVYKRLARERGGTYAAVPPEPATRPSTAPER